MRKELYRIDSLNMANVMLDTMDHIKNIVGYFDQHGNANERLLAHYLQGRVAADKGDVPQALHHYLDALSCADTTSADCDYKKLSKVYGQMARLYHHQRMADSEIDAYKMAIRCAQKANDTLNMGKFTEHMADGYYFLNKMDSVIYYKQQAIDIYDKLGKDELSNAAWGLIFFAYINQGDYVHAKRAMEEVKKSRLLFKTDGDTREGMEIYYYFVGKYFEHANRLDSAEHFYRKIQHSKSADSIEASSSGLLSVYHKKRNIDSVFKYATQYTQAVDTASYRHAADEMVRMQSVYNYEQSERKAAKKEKEAYQYRFSLVIAIMGLITLTLLAVWIYRHQKQKQRQQIIDCNSKYAQLLSQYDATQRELTQLQQNAKQYKATKEDELERLKEQLNEYISADMLTKRWTTEIDIIQAPIVCRLHDLASRAKQPTTEEWAQLRQHASKAMPAFIKSLHPYSLTYQELTVCLLIKLQFVHSEIASLMGVSKQRITNLRAHVNTTVFGEKGSPSLDKNLMLL